MTISTVLRRRMPANIPAAMIPGAAAALSATPAVTGDGPVFDAIEWHSQATQALSHGARAAQRTSPAAAARGK
jgi:hypothetical protein